MNIQDTAVTEGIVDIARQFNVQCRHFQIETIDTELGRSLMRMLVAANKIFIEAGPEHYNAILMDMLEHAEGKASYIKDIMTFLTTMYGLYNSIETHQRTAKKFQAL
jgi:hypothetical protein